MADRFSIDLILILWNDAVLGRVLVEELSEFSLLARDLVNEGVEEALALTFVVEAVLGEGYNVEPDLLVHPRELLVAVIDTGT